MARYLRQYQLQSLNYLAPPPNFLAITAFNILSAPFYVFQLFLFIYLRKNIYFLGHALALRYLFIFAQARFHSVQAFVAKIITASYFFFFTVDFSFLFKKIYLFSRRQRKQGGSVSEKIKFFLFVLPDRIFVNPDCVVPLAPLSLQKHLQLF